VRSMTDTIGRWLVYAGQMVGLTLQEMKGEGESAFLHMLSGQVQFPVLHDSSVGVSCGRAISSCMFTMRSNRGFRSLLGFVRWLLCMASQVLMCDAG